MATVLDEVYVIVTLYSFPIPLVPQVNRSFPFLISPFLPIHFPVIFPHSQAEQLQKLPFFSVNLSFLRMSQITKHSWSPPLFFRISLKDTSFCISLKFLGLYLSAEWLLNFLSKLYIPPCVRKIFKFTEFTFIGNVFIWGIFNHPSLHLKLTPRFLYHALDRRKINSFTQAEFFRKSVCSYCRKRWRKLWFALSNISYKIWTWLGTLGFLYFVWFAVFLKCNGFTVL